MQKNNMSAKWLLAITILLCFWIWPGAVWAKTADYEYKFLDIAVPDGWGGTISGIACNDFALYIAAVEYANDARWYTHSLLKYDLKSGRADLIILKDEPGFIKGLAVTGDRAVIAGVRRSVDDDGSYGRPYFALVDLGTRETLDEVALDVDCYECLGYDIEHMGNSRFAVSIPGQNKVLFLSITDENKLAVTGEAGGLRDAKGLCWFNGKLYVGGSTRVNHTTRGAVYVVDVETGQSELFMTVMESRGGFNGLWIKRGLVVASNFHNSKLLGNSLFVFGFDERKLLAEIKDLPIPTPNICFGGLGGLEIYAMDNHDKILEIRLDFKELHKKLLKP